LYIQKAILLKPSSQTLCTYKELNAQSIDS
jgi:hypothetical protein